MDRQARLVDVWQRIVPGHGRGLPQNSTARTALWHIQYDDGDAEDFQLQDLLHGMREHDRRERERKAIQKKDSHKLIFKRRRAAVSVASA